MKTILAIDGGGIKGIIPCMILSKIEELTGSPISSLFDLMAGTSTGGFLALGLAVSDEKKQSLFKANQFLDIYTGESKNIFSRSLWQSLSSINGLYQKKYDTGSLEEKYEQVFKNLDFSSVNTNVMISSYDIENRNPFFFKSWKEEFKNIHLKTAARATSAAPAYFKPLQTKINNKSQTLIDGAIFLNNPAFAAYIEAKKLFKTEDILIISLGTGHNIVKYSYDKVKNWGFAGWTVPAMKIMYDEMSHSSDYFLSCLKKERFFRYQIELDNGKSGIDNIEKENIAYLIKKAEDLYHQNQDEIRELCDILMLNKRKKILKFLSKAKIAKKLKIINRKRVNKID